jgi:hypothetical protein
MTELTQDTTIDNNEQLETNEERHQEQLEQTEEEIQRDAQAAKMAAELGLDDAELDPDFDPSQAVNMSPEQEAQVLQQTQDMLQTSEGAQMAAIGAIDWYEELLQEHGHEKYTISDKKKVRGTKRLTPVIQKYAPEILGLFGQYKNEVMAALFVGSLTYGSVKQIKALKAEDLAEDKRLHPEKYETKEPATTTEKAA